MKELITRTLLCLLEKDLKKNSSMDETYLWPWANVTYRLENNCGSKGDNSWSRIHDGRHIWTFRPREQNSDHWNVRKKINKITSSLSLRRKDKSNKSHFLASKVSQCTCPYIHILLSKGRYFYKRRITSAIKSTNYEILQYPRR